MAGVMRVTVPEEIRLDRAAKRYCGTEQDGMVERLLALNPGLAGQGGWVPAGTALAVPAPARADALTVVPSINPWE